MMYRILIGIFLFSLFQACSSKSKKQSESNSSSSYKRSHETSSSSFSNEEEDYSSSSGCKYEDGAYSATVDYYNPKTGYSETYTLDVEVEDCEVVQINFSNGGWLDNDHITPAELDEDGNCTVDGEDGKTYKIQIDN